MTEFTPLASLAGGLLIGGCAVLTLLLFGRIMGVSGLLGGLLPPRFENYARLWPVTLILGIVIAPIIWTKVLELDIAIQPVAFGPILAVAGLLVGFGASYGSGCTSGHGVCGLSRLSVRSIAATVTFMITAFLTVLALRLMGAL